MEYKVGESYTVIKPVYVYKAPFITASRALISPYQKKRKVVCYGTLIDPDGNTWMRIRSYKAYFRYIPVIFKKEVYVK